MTMLNSLLKTNILRNWSFTNWNFLFLLWSILDHRIGFTCSSITETCGLDTKATGLHDIHFNIP